MSLKTKVQCIVFDKHIYPEAQMCQEWLIDHGFKASFGSSKLQQDDYSYKFRQFNPKQQSDIANRTIQYKEGINFIVECELKPKRQFFNKNQQGIKKKDNTSASI